MEKRYKGDINIQYIFYPLDMSCNDAIKRPIMQYSCQAAYLATCLEKDFVKVHDDIFANQANLNSKWINNYAKKRGVEECLKDPKTKEKVVSVIELSRPFNVTSTPTMLINGAKIAGVIPPNQLFLLLDGVLGKEKK
jgi:protein-disulfide isomerase